MGPSNVSANSKASSPDIRRRGESARSSSRQTRRARPERLDEEPQTEQDRLGEQPVSYQYQEDRREQGSCLALVRVFVAVVIARLIEVLLGILLLGQTYFR